MTSSPTEVGVTGAVDAAAQPATMHCMEVWGGNEPFDAAVRVSGLDAWVYCRPYQHAQAGGDVYFVSSCATGRITRLLVADVSGHGDAVGPVGKDLRTLMRRYVNYLDQSAFVLAMNAKFTELSAANCFATAIACTYFGPTRQLSLCNAGHPLPMLYRSKSGQWQMLNDRCAGNIPLGIDDVCEYQQFDLDLEPGDLVLCHTDSLVEARRPDGAMLGPEGLLELVRALNAADASRLIAALLAAVAAAGYITDDDVTALLFRPNDHKPNSTFFRRLTAPLRVAAATLASLFPGTPPAPLPDFSLANLGGLISPRLGRRRRPIPFPGTPRKE